MKSPTTTQTGLYVLGAVVGLYLLGAALVQYDLRQMPSRILAAPAPIQRTAAFLYNPLFLWIGQKTGFYTVFFLS